MKKAFTLIELLVVIAIIAILAAILFPVFAQAKAAAKAAANLSNLKQLALANIQYANDSDDSFPLAIQEGSVLEQQAYFLPANGVTLTTTPAGIIPWQEGVFPYTKNRDIYTTPLDSTPTGTGPVKQFLQEQFYGVLPRAASLAYRDANSNFALLTPYANGGAGAFIDGPFGAFAAPDAAFVSVNNTPSLTQSGIDHISDVIMVADAGAFDMGFTTTTSAPVGSATSPACTSTVGVNGSSPVSVYAGPWSRRQQTGAWNGGKACIYEAGQQGAITYAATDGSAKRVAMTQAYKTDTINNNTGVAVHDMYVSATDAG